MKRLLSVPAYIWAIICMLIIPVTFMGNDYFAGKMATLPFMKINPVYTGGDSARCFMQDSMTITINKPVFESLIGKPRKGFVQVKYSGILPDLIHSNIDYNNDGQPDFYVDINTSTGETNLEALSLYVSGLEVSSKVNDFWIVRVKLLNEVK